MSVGSNPTGIRAKGSPHKGLPFITDMTPTKPQTAGSFSRVVEFERCPFLHRSKNIDKIETPPNPFSERGILLHKAHEDYVTGKRDDIHPELAKFTHELTSLRERYKAGAVEVEQEWGFDRNWKPCDWRDWDNVWLRIKLDDFVNLDAETGLVIDLKTGRKYGNEIKHADQGLLYAGAAFLRYPAKKKIIVEMHYADQPENDKLSRVEYTPQYAAKGLVSFEKRLNNVLKANFFPPKPNIFNCRYCPYGRLKGNGYCKASA